MLMAGGDTVKTRPVAAFVSFGRRAATPTTLVSYSKCNSCYRMCVCVCVMMLVVVVKSAMIVSRCIRCKAKSSQHVSTSRFLGLSSYKSDQDV